MTEDRELRQYRDLMRPPESYEEGFGLKAIIGAMFVGLVMAPGAIYMGLVAGMGLGSAPQWVTVILFLEVAKRSFTTLKKQELFILFAMAGGIMANPFSGFLWNQFLVQSDAAAAMGVADKVPSWVAPGPAVLAQRTFFHRAWLVPVLIVFMNTVVSQISNLVLGYTLFRIASDVEKLPFPMAPVGAMGITALAESSSGRETWRWRTFSIGGAIGLLFGLLYIALPSISGALLNEKIEIFPIPWSDFTQNTENILPAVPVGIVWDIGNLIFGMVLPFYAMVGSFVGVLVTMIANPFMYKYGILHTWQKGMNTQLTTFSNSLDFYLSFGIGVALAVAIVGFYHIFATLRDKSVHADDDRAKTPGRGRFDPPKGRGDWSLWLAIPVYILSCLLYIGLCHYWLVPDFPVIVLFGFAFLYTPIISYATARLEGIAGQVVDIPFIRELTFILWGRGVGIWFAPIPIFNYGGVAVMWRQVELTGTRFTSLWKMEAVRLPTILLCGFLFSEFIWRLAPIPSQAYPFAEKMWELQAMQQCLIISSTLEGGSSPFYEALKGEVVGVGLGFGLVGYSVLALFGLPVLFIYGVIRGFGHMPHSVFPQFAGALLGRYYFSRKFGDRWKQYAIVLAAGYSCGIGLISTLSVGFVFLSKSVFQLPY
ncbi:MAG TPA: peptide transporter [Candidatus Brocadiia bacterium]|nr:peptide transporter [Candidatus Brocadiia bacterium]